DERLRVLVRGGGEGELLGRGEVVEHIGHGRGHGQQYQPAHSGAGRPGGGLGGRLEPEGDARALVDERRVPADDPAGDLRVDEFGQLADRPVGEAGALRDGAGRGGRPGTGCRGHGTNVCTAG